MSFTLTYLTWTSESCAASWLRRTAVVKCRNFWCYSECVPHFCRKRHSGPEFNSLERAKTSPICQEPDPWKTVPAFIVNSSDCSYQESVILLIEVIVMLLTSLGPTILAHVVLDEVQPVFVSVSGPISGLSPTSHMIIVHTGWVRIKWLMVFGSNVLVRRSWSVWNRSVLTLCHNEPYVHVVTQWLQQKCQEAPCH